MHTFKYATPTLITEALHLVTQVRLLLIHCYSELMPYTMLDNSYGVSVYDVYPITWPCPLTMTTTVAI